MELKEILNKLQEFKILNIKFENNIIKLQIEVNKGENLKEKENYIKLILNNFKTEIIFILKKESEKKIKKIIGICSGKGGVGKSTITTNLALYLKQEGFKVGILDADIYTPSIPFLFNIKEKPISLDGQLIEPIIKNEIKILSIGLMLEENQSLIWQPNILGNSFKQLFQQGNWEVDYLIIDLPPGITELFEIFKNLIEEIELIIVTTPNKISYIDTKKLYILLKNYNLKIKGIIENSINNEKNENNNFQELKEKYSEIELIEKIPFINNFEKYSQNCYLENHKFNEEEKYFKNIIKKINLF